jgi:hypothetical protein
LNANIGSDEPFGSAIAPSTGTTAVRLPAASEIEPRSFAVDWNRPVSKYAS